jgi:hypothetical protein
MFKEEREDYQFQWKDIGNIQKGRPNLGETITVSVYRLMQYTLRDVLIKEFNVDKAGELFVKAGKRAGVELCKNVLNTKLNFNEFIADLQQKLKTLNIGILRIEKADIEKMEFILAIEEDLDCSGLPVSGETVCDYDEGFIAGILNAYTGNKFNVKEVDCWTSGGTVCKFHAKLEVKE